MWRNLPNLGLDVWVLGSTSARASAGPPPASVPYPAARTHGLPLSSRRRTEVAARSEARRDVLRLIDVNLPPLW